MKDVVYIGFARAAQLLGKSRATVYRLMSSGKLTPHYKPKNPRTPTFLRSQIDSLNLPGPREAPMNFKLHKQAKERDGKCAICFSDGDLHAHHVIPIEQGGADSIDNLATVCSGCHRNIHMDHGCWLKPRAIKNKTEAITNWLLRSAGSHEIDFGLASKPAEGETARLSDCVVVLHS